VYPPLEPEEGWSYGSSGTVPACQVQDAEFKPSTTRLKEREPEHVHEMLRCQAKLDLCMIGGIVASRAKPDLGTDFWSFQNEAEK
jgi:hypothetical protein